MNKKNMRIVISYNAALSRSKYQFTVKSIYFGFWTANVMSMIKYNYGNASIIKNDFFSDQIIYPNISQVKNYFYANIIEVGVVLSGTYDGKTLTPVKAKLTP